MRTLYNTRSEIADLMHESANYSVLQNLLSALGADPVVACLRPETVDAIFKDINDWLSISGTFENDANQRVMDKLNEEFYKGYASYIDCVNHDLFDIDLEARQQEINFTDPIV